MYIIADEDDALRDTPVYYIILIQYILVLLHDNLIAIPWIFYINTLSVIVLFVIKASINPTHFS